MTSHKLKDFTMAERKNITVNFYRLESTLDTFYQDLEYKLEAMAEGGMDYGFFDGKSCELMFKIFEPIQLSDRKLYPVSLIKEKIFLPVWFNRDGQIQEAPLDGGSLGDVSYALIDTDRQAILTLSGGFGPSISGFSDFVRWLSGDAAAGASPIFIGDVYDQVNQWEIFRKLNLTIEAPAVDFVDNVLGSDLGENFKMLETLSGLKIDISVSMGHGKGSLHKEAVKNFIRTIMEDNFAGKLKVMGKSFEEQATAEHDIYNARLKHKTEIVIAGSHIAPDEARSSLYEAYQLHLDDIEAAAARGLEDE